MGDSSPAILARFKRLLDAGWIDRARFDVAFVRQHEKDELGTRIHAALACLFLLGASGPTTVAEISGFPLVVFFFIRFKHTCPLWGRVFIDVRFLLLLALASWMAISVLWSREPAQGLDELGGLRWSWCMLVLLPVLDRRRLLIAFFAAGLLMGNAAQLAHALQELFGIELWTRAPGRKSGWWDPVVGGSLLCGALGLHLPAAMMGSGRIRMIAIAGSLITLAGIGATGTRGAWIASALLLAIVFTVSLARVRPRRVAFARVGIALTIVVVAGGLAGYSLRDSALADRLDAGYKEAVAAIRDGQFQSDTGARVYMNAKAVEAFAANPVEGVGAGGYREWVIEADPEFGAESHDHAHSALLHLAATLGLVGLAIAGLLVVCVIRGGLRAATCGLGSYGAGPVFALVGLLLAGIFDTVQLNAQTAAQLGILIALCPPLLPPQWPAKDRD